MNLGIIRVNSNYTPHFAGNSKNVAKEMSSIDKIYEKELIEIRKQKQEQKAAYLLRPETPLEQAKNKIRNMLLDIFYSG